MMLPVVLNKITGRALAKVNKCPGLGPDSVDENAI